MKLLLNLNINILLRSQGTLICRGHLSCMNVTFTKTIESFWGVCRQQWYWVEACVVIPWGGQAEVVYGYFVEYVGYKLQFPSGKMLNF